MTVTWHDSCHMGRAGEIYEAPRKLIQAIPGIEFVEMEHNRQEAHCCGSVLSLVADPDVGERVGDVRLQEAEDAGAAGGGRRLPLLRGAVPGHGRQDGPRPAHHRPGPPGLRRRGHRAPRLDAPTPWRCGPSSRP